MKRSAFYRLVACFVIVTIAASATNVFAGEPAREAFLRGGTAIREALSAKTVEATLVAPELLPSPRVIPPGPAAQQSTAVQTAPNEGRRRIMLWIGLGVTGAIASYLVWRGVKDHGHVFGEGK
jgi:hypothetical protein